MYYIISKIMILIISISVCKSLLQYPSSMCKKQDIQSCSFQLLHNNQNSCFVYNTSVCLKNEAFTHSNRRLSSQSEAQFSVSVQSYSAIFFELQKSLPLSAVNISFEIHNIDVKGISIMLRDGIMNRTFCRILDFTTYTNKTVPFSLFYDCFYNMVEDNLQNITITFKSLPFNDELSYLLFIPAASTYGSKCNWQPLIMIFCEALSEGNIQIKFSEAPSYINITSYLIELVQVPSNEVIKSINIVSSIVKKMGYVEFREVPYGSYYVVVQPKNGNESQCFSSKTAIFNVTLKTFGKMLIFYICICILFFIGLILIIKFLHRYVKPDMTLKQALLLYSYDCPEHEAFISLFCAYLTCECRINVSTIYGTTQDSEKWIHHKDAEINTKDPNQYIKDKYYEADIIIIVMSEQLCLALKNKSKVLKMKEGSPWRQQLFRCFSYIYFQIFNSETTRDKKFCKIYFPYSSKQTAPCLTDFGRSFSLPEEFNNFLCFVFDRHFIPFVNLHYKLPGSDPHSSEIGKNMLNGIKTVQKVFADLQSNRNCEMSLHAINCEDSDAKNFDTLDKIVKDYLNTDWDVFDPVLEDWENFLVQNQNINDDCEHDNHMTQLMRKEFSEN